MTLYQINQPVVVGHLFYVVGYLFYVQERQQPRDMWRDGEEQKWADLTYEN